MSKLILIGGSFNPVHLGHLKLMSLACNMPDVAKVVIMPTYCSPFKLASGQLAAAYRWKLLELALADLIDLEQDFEGISKAEQLISQQAYQSKKLELMDLEIKSDAPSYTWTTIKKLQSLYPDFEIVLLGGSDLIADFENWYAFRDILKTVKLLIVTRPGYIGDKLLADCDKLVKTYQAAIDLLPVDMPDISSATLRTELRNVPTAQAYSLTDSDICNYYADESLLNIFPKICRTYLTRQECAFIAQNRLYQQADLSALLNNDTVKLLHDLQNYNLKHLPWNRQIHCLNVAYFALTLLIAKYQLKTLTNREQIAKIFAAPWQNFNLHSLNDLERTTCGQTIIAGLFHDACKYEDLHAYPEVMAKLTEEDKVTKIEHGPLAAYVLEHKFNCHDQAILEAIYFHTTLRPDATLLDKLVYLADKLEFGRVYEDVPALRRSLILGYDETIKRVLQKTLALLTTKKQIAHSLTRRALAYLEEEKM